MENAPDMAFAISVCEIDLARAQSAPPLTTARKKLARMPRGSMREFAHAEIAKLSVMRDIAALSRVSNEYIARTIATMNKSPHNTFYTMTAELRPDPQSIYEYFCDFNKSVGARVTIDEPPKLTLDRDFSARDDVYELGAIMRRIALITEEQIAVLREVAQIEAWCVVQHTIEV